MSDRTERAAGLLGRVFDELHDQPPSDPAEYQLRRADFVFHMTDWLGDLDCLHQVLNHPDGVDPDQFAPQVYGILSHVIPHLRAAFRTLEGYEAPDPFAPQNQMTSGAPANGATG